MVAIEAAREWLPGHSVVTYMESVYILKQLSSSNWEFERDHCEQVLQQFGEEFHLEVSDYPVGKNNKNKNSGKTLVVIFTEPASNELLAEMRWAIHVRFG